MKYVSALLLIILSFSALSVCGAEMSSMLGTNEAFHLNAALQYMNMTESDLGFTKDIAEPQLVLTQVREILHQPLLLPAMGDTLLTIIQDMAVGKTNVLWPQIASWLDTTVDAPTAVSVDTRSRDWDVLEYNLAFLISTFVLKAEKAQGLLRQTFSKITPQEQSYMAASLLGGIFNVEDHDDVRRELTFLGIPPSIVQQVIDENLQLDPEPAATNYIAQLATIDLKSILTAGYIMEEAIEVFYQAHTNVTEWPEQVISFPSRLGMIYVGTYGNDHYTQPAFLIVDPGGNDVYGDGCAHANGLQQNWLGAILDLAGNDRYEGISLTGPGTALFGSVVLFDASGNDHYQCQYSGQAAGLFGSSILIDLNGDDFYSAQALAQGAGYVGTGILIDKGGNDVFKAGMAAQGYSGILGFGLLADFEGNDFYLAGGVEPDYERHPERFVSLAQGFSIGMRPFGGGGIAALVDLKGNDTYNADVYGQGVGYWYAVGMLLDAEGCDTYAMHHYGQGSGIHLSSGLLYDGAGHDMYTGYILAQGNAHDYAVGMLLDQKGNDTYTADHHAQGRALNNALGILIDSSGDDVYFARQNDRCQGIGNDGDKREYGSLALLLDLDGKDRYSCGAEDGARMLRPNFGIVYDVLPEPTDEEVAPLSVQEAAGNLTNMPLEELMVDANRYGTTEEKLTRKYAAQEEIMNRGSESLTYLINNTHLKNMWFWIFSRMLVEKLPAEEAMPILLAATTSEKQAVKKSAIYFMSYYDTPENATAIQPFISDEKLAGVTMRTLGKWHATNAVPEILPYMHHEKERLRIVAVNALRDIGDPSAVPALVVALGDPVFTVRNAAARALGVIGQPAEPALLEAYEQAGTTQKRQILRTLSDLRSADALLLIEAAQSDSNPGIREDAHRAYEILSE